MILTSPSTPYSLQISGEWCRVIHNHQIRLCSHCDGVGHSRKKKNCPIIECQNAKQLGHLSFLCPLKTPCHTESTDDEHANTENTQRNTPEEKESTPTLVQESLTETSSIEQETTTQITPVANTNEEKMGTTRDIKCPHQTDSDSDPNILPHHQRIKPTPNINAARPHKKAKDMTTKS